MVHPDESQLVGEYPEGAVVVAGTGVSIGGELRQTFSNAAPLTLRGPDCLKMDSRGFSDRGLIE